MKFRYVGKRTLWWAILLSFVAILTSKQIVQAKTEHILRIVWRVPVAHIDTVKSSLVFEGDITEEKNTKALPLIYVIAGVVLLPDFVSSLVDVIDKIKRGGGLKIDARGDPIRVEIDPLLDRGTMIIVDKNGTTRFLDKDERSGANELLDILKTISK